jgi:hypothetical protein
MVTKLVTILVLILVPLLSVFVGASLNQAIEDLPNATVIY